ncbi:unnamed protein product [Effrenium voratum]|nr:unnamed protein product [Effrenium voratum]
MALWLPVSAPSVEAPALHVQSRSALRARPSRGSSTPRSHRSPVQSAAVGFGLAAFARHSRAFRAARAQGSGASRSAVSLRAARIDTFLVPGKMDAGKLAMAVAPLAAHIDLSCLCFFGLNVDPALIASVAGGALGIHGMCPVYIADCYGIIGWDKKEGKNVEMMEKGRGSEYGKPGGQGGEGVVVVAFRGKEHGGGGLHMVVKAHGKAELEAVEEGVSYGGFAKACYKLEHSGDLVEVDEFVVSSSVPSAVVSFDGDDAKEVAAGTAKKLPGAATAAGYFPCFCRGYNKYEKDGVEPEAFAGSLEGVPLFGMFAHGELGPLKATGAVAVAAGEAPQTEHEQHSMTSILALYA